MSPFEKKTEKKNKKQQIKKGMKLLITVLQLLVTLCD